MRKRYTYETLSDPGQIRLFKFVTSDATAKHEDISVVLNAFSIDDAPSYLALSYCWGARRWRKRLECNRSSLSITKTFHHILEQARWYLTSDPDRAELWLWADQLCINQNDVHERSNQVSLMGRIYAEALYTLICLGAVSGDNGAGIELLDTLYDVVVKSYPNHTDMAYFPKQAYDKQKHDDNNLPPTEDKRWAWLRSMLSCKWFERLWIFQEVLLSCGDPVLLCGGHVYPWVKLSTVATWLEANDYYGRGLVPSSVYSLRSMRTVRKTRRKWNLSSLSFMTGGDFHATDARDKIYGLLGLASDAASLFSEAISIDYLKSPSKVYQDWARHIIPREKNLTILDYSLCFSRQVRDPYRCFGRQIWWENVPSWTPNLDGHLTHPTNFLRVIDAAAQSTVEWDVRCRASGEIEVNGGRSDITQHVTQADHDVLPLTGLRIDQIENIFEVIDPLNLWFQGIRWRKWPFRSLSWVIYRDIEEHKHLGRVRMLLSHVHSLVHGFHQPLILRLWHELVQNRHCNDVLALAKSVMLATTAGLTADQNAAKEGHLADFCVYMTELYTSWSSSFPASSERFHASFTMLQEASSEGDGTRFERAMWLACARRRCFITEQGNVGVGPTGQAKGDKIVVLFGGGVPFVLRPYKKQWLMIGPAYVQ